MVADREEMRSACVDVIIAVWNNADTIERAIRSALSAPEVSRVIVVDDRSTDETASVVTALAGEFIRLHLRHHHALHRGIAGGQLLTSQAPTSCV